MTQKQIFEAANRFLIDEIQFELYAQGHRLTGSLEASISGKIVEAGDFVVLTGTAFSYLQILDLGVTPGRVPYGGGRGQKGGTSKYIQALIQYFVKRGLDEKEAKRAAFATAAKHKEEGISTSASSRFSETGKRQDVLGEVARGSGAKLDQIVIGGLDRMIDEEFHKTRDERI